MTPRRPRLVDIAERLDLAPSTVSRALAGSDGVSAQTRDRVERAAREIGYAVNPAASGLKTGSTLNIGLVAVMSYWYAGVVTSGADRVAAAEGYDFVVMNAVGTHDSELLVQRARRLGQRVDGVLINDVVEGELLDDLISAVGVPVVTLGCRSAGVSSVEVDNLRVGAMAARHLRDLGHDRAMVLSDELWSPLAFPNDEVRAEGFIAEFGAGARAATLPRRVPQGEERRRLILDVVADATAVFCTTDALAIETSAVLRQAGRPVPEQVSVVGVDDHPLAEPVGLSTIAQTPEEMGAAAVRQLLAQIQDDAATASVLMPTTLVPRLTSGPAPGG